MIVGPVARALKIRPVYEPIVPADHFETRFAKLTFDHGGEYFVVLRFRFTGLLVGWQRTSIDNDESASWVKRLEHAIQNGSGVHEFVISVCDKDGINLPFWQTRVFWVTVNNMNVTPMTQACSDP
jgi:hypothetical protein